MPSDNSTKPSTVWPLPKFSFHVNFGPGKSAIFQEACGLADGDAPAIESQPGNRPAHQTAKMPGIKKVGNVTLKKGACSRENSFWTWYSQIKMNAITRGNVIIQLLDEQGAPAMTWTLTNAWPTKITGTDLKSDGNEVAVECVELAHEGITISNP